MPNERYIDGLHQQATEHNKQYCHYTKIPISNQFVPVHIPQQITDKEIDGIRNDFWIQEDTTQ